MLLQIFFMHRFFTDQELGVRKKVMLHEEQSRQIRKVLRLKIKDEIVLFNGLGGEFIGRIIDSDEMVMVELQYFHEVRRELDFEITLFQAVIKRERCEWVAQKTTELGVAKLIPVRAERSGPQHLKIDRIRKIIVEAVEQSERTKIPKVEKEVSFEVMKQRLSDFDQVFLAHARCHDSSAPLPTIAAGSQVALLIGPEGGWSKKEASALQELTNVQMISLGRTILRAETAAIVGVAMLRNIIR